MRFVRELTSWLSGAGEPDSFPYSAVLAEFHRVGKHFVDKELLALLDQARAQSTVPAAARDAHARLLGDFLDAALDKWDGRYDYRSYLALRLLRLPCGDDVDDGPAADPVGARRDRDRLLVRLVADALAFELTAASGTTDLLPERRPSRDVVAKRYRLGVRAASPALVRMGLAGTVPHREAVATPDELRALAADPDPTGELVLRLSMLPVHVTHDEYLFIRVLQAYECLFAGIADELRATVAALSAGHAGPAVERLAYAREQLTAAGPLFSLLATMQAEAFRTFREFTEGASAIQSRSYKLMESLCRTPEGSRLDSAAYHQVPEVRDRVHAGRPSVDDAFRAAVRDGLLAAPGGERVEEEMRSFAAAVVQWRRTHHRLATRMLGPRPGTGYTEGTPYLAAVRSIPVFTSVADDSRSPSPTDPTGGSPE
ncbi:tryptophan 2,3-dioxygenase family protein [Micromonospora sp. DSM 115977]|uniref:Tryptophan 2,3-dioxygenase family protein n=1 Tax=Micromonospora reichwaldensis TaxID=3075516 RepID=A0ABU2X0F1_9ACTN|nr:tryptophan 2,3-dioxygenase family protein [Micromonospora sp. DSM 115977]MDT0531660.1 tryptophan 2,3-dioxygenase family protein [Micromonospora sp. DSM 115977]